MLNVKLIVLGIVLAIAAGCGSGMEAEVAGRVTLDGKPVGPGTIVFAPTDGVSNPADGAIQVDGTYFLKTSRDVGLAAGKYNVGVTVLDQPHVEPGQRSMEAARFITPEKYADPASSGLQYEVKPGRNTIDVELRSE